MIKDSVSKWGGKVVNERTAMQTTAIYSCMRILLEVIVSLPVHLRRYAGRGKERVYDHPLYYLLHDDPNPEMIFFVFRETVGRKSWTGRWRSVLLWGCAKAAWEQLLQVATVVINLTPLNVIEGAAQIRLKKSG